MSSHIMVKYFSLKHELMWFFPDFRIPSLNPNSLAKNSKLAFREEFFFQIYHNFSYQYKQNGLILISCINTIFGEIFGGLKDQVWNLDKRSFCPEQTDIPSLPHGLSVHAALCVSRMQSCCATRLVGPHRCLHLTPAPHPPLLPP